jgi:hypothetical protein
VITDPNTRKIKFDFILFDLIAFPFLFIRIIMTYPMMLAFGMAILGGLSGLGEI